MDWILYPEEWSLLAAVCSLILVLVLAFVFGVRWRLAWLQLPAATRDAELTMLVTRRETQLYDLEQQKKALEDEVRNVESRVLERDRLEAEADHWKSQVEVAKAEYAGLEAMRREVEDVREEYRQALEKLGETETQVGQAKGALEDLRQRAEAVMLRMATTEGEIEDRSRALEELRQKVEETKAVLTKELAELTEARRSLEETRERESHLTREIETLEARQRSQQEILRQQEDQLEGTKNELERLAVARRDLEPAQKELEATEKKLDDRNQRVARLRSEEGQLNAQIAQLKGERQASERDGDPLKDLRTPPTCLGRKGEKSAPDESEAAALERVRKCLKESGFDFHDRQIKAFHTSLKTAVISPLTVLAGISGTGKSQLPRYYAEAMGMQFLKIPVQPRWDGPQDLFGFYNYIESRYRATDLAQALVHLDPHNWAKEAEPFKDRMLLVLLDEMNLARVEYYFSEFLSRLEGRPLDDGATDGASRGPSEIEIDVSRSGQNGEEGESRRVYVGQNVLFVGTMNEDESTQSLSDKVLDRANVLRFPKPEKLETEIPGPKPGKQRGYLPKLRWLGQWMRAAGDLDDLQRVRGYIEDLNDIMGTHETSRNLDPQLHTHAVIANMVQGADGKWRTMANEKLYSSKMLIGALYRGELARKLTSLGYGIEKTHADGRFEIAGVSREVIDAFSTRRAEIEAAMDGRGLGTPAENQRAAQRAALMTRAAKRDVDRAELREMWQRQADGLGFDARALAADAMDRSRDAGKGIEAGRVAASNGAAVRQGDLFDPPPQSLADAAMAWAVEHLSEREAVFAKTDLLAAALAWKPGSVTIGEAEATVARLEKEGTLHACGLPAWGESLTTDKAVADEKETIALMGRGQGTSRPVMRSWIAGPLLHNGRLTDGQKEAVKTILSSKDRVVGVQGYAGTGKTTMLDRARQLAAKSGYRTIGVAPSASAARTLATEAGIETETLQRFLARNAGIAEGRLTRKGAREMRAAFRKTVLVVDEGSLASTVQARDLLRIAAAIRIPRVVLVGDRKQLDAVDAGKPFAQLQAAGMKTAVMDEILRQKDGDLQEAVRASLAGEIGRAFGKLGDRIAEVNPDNLAGAAAARWLKLSPHERENTGLMAPSHALRTEINGHIRERLARDGVIRGPAYEAERLVSLGYTSAEKMVAGNYSPGDVVAFHRDYKSLGVVKGDERRVAGVDHRKGSVTLEGPEGQSVAWWPRQVGAKRGAVEVYRTESMELRAGDRIRWTRNDTGLGLVNSDTAEVASVRGDRVAFRLGDGRTLELGKNDPQIRHLDHAWASTVHAFQGRTVDNVIAVMEAKHPKLSTQKSFYVEISRARHSAELVTDDAKTLRETLEAATGERVSALEGIGTAEKALAEERARGDEKERGRGLEGMLERPAGARDETADKSRGVEREKVPEPERAAELDKFRGSRGIEMEM